MLVMEAERFGGRRPCAATTRPPAGLGRPASTWSWPTIWRWIPADFRPARVQDVKQMARVHVRCWQETYRGLVPDAVLDDPGFPAARERMWTMS